MFTRKRKLICVLLVICCIALILLASCQRKPNDNPNNPGSTSGYGIDGVYYTVDDGFEYLFTITGNSFMLSGLNGDQSGTFTYENGTLTLTFKQGDTANASAKLENGVLELTYNGGVYRLLQRTQFTVSFDTDGGSAVAAQKVYNGSLAEKPADPAKEGYAFIGWYTDKAYTTAFDFGSAMITADTTVYARFEAHATGQVEYTASFISADQAFEPAKTVNGILYNLPTPAAKEGMTFVGWWMSDSQSASKLTCKYTGQKLTQDTMLFAVYAAAGTPVVSVNAAGVTWEALGAGVNYRVVIRYGETVVADSNTGSAEFKYDFTGKDAGEYEITVTANGNSTTVYYRNKALDRVSGFRVYPGNVLVFHPVAGAEKYVISFKCGSKNHTHTEINNGTSTYYTFANCEMPENGITFVVTAYAEGYVSSTATYTYFRGLDAVSGITVINNRITWLPVDNAATYIVSISADGENYTDAYVTSGTSYSIAGLGKGNYYVKVTPVCAGYYVAPATAVQFTKNTLSAPTGIALSGNSLTWNAVENAVSYIVYINGTAYPAEKNSLALTEEIFGANLSDCKISVQAVAADAAENSAVSAEITVSRVAMSEVSYRNGKVYWSPVYGAAKYLIRVGNESFEVNGNESSADISFTESGSTEISVSFINSLGDASEPATITVEVYAVELDVRGGTKTVNVLYKAFGDEFELPETVRDGYSFAGWYTTPNGYAVGKEYTSGVFEGQSDIVLYANWSSRKYTVTLVYGEGENQKTTTIEVAYGKINKSPIAESPDPTLFFNGWYTGIGGSGICYFDANGETEERWNTPNDITLYAQFADPLKYDEIDNGNAYSVSKGPFGIGNIKELTIPVSYNDKPITTIEASGFNSCYTLLKIRIPNTVTNIAIPSTGINTTGSAFQYCSKLSAIEIYDAGAKEPKYFSDDGVLYTYNGENGIAIKAVPMGKTGIFRIYEGTVSIPAGAFASCKLSEIIIPHTVGIIEAKGISSCSSLTKLTFLPAPEGVEEIALTLKNNAIYSCSKLTEVVLPGRMETFSEKSIGSCSYLSSIDISGTSKNYTAKGEEGRKVLCDAAGTTLIFCPKGMAGEFKIPAGITTIGEGAFTSCSKLTKVTIPGYVTTIEKEAFKSCTKLAELILEEDGQALTIKTFAFQSCSGLTELTLPARLVKLEEHAFASTSKLAKVTVNSVGVKGEDGKYTLDFADVAFGTKPSSSTVTPTYYVTDLVIGDNVPAFNISAVFGKKLDTITLSEKNGNYTSENGILYNVGKTNILFFPTAYSGEYTIPDTVTEIAANTFQGKTKLTSVVIGPNIKAIGDYAFQGCSALTTITFTPAAQGVEEIPLTIGASAFDNCKLLQNPELPARLTSIGENAFKLCGSLTHVVIPEGVKSLGNGAFYNCSSLVTVTLPSTLEKITKIETDEKTGLKTDAFEPDDFNVFYFCRKLTNIIVASGNKHFIAVDSILYTLADRTDKDGNPTLGPDILLCCPVLKQGETNVKVPEGVTHVVTNAFYLNTTVKSLSFSDVKEFTVGPQAFYYASALESIKLPTGLTSLSKSMFHYCQKLKAVEIPYTVSVIENKAFYYCASLASITFAPTPAGVTPVELVINDATTEDNGSYGPSGTTAPFGNCPKLTTIAFPERLTELGNRAFGGYSGYSNYGSNIVSVSLPSTITRIGDYAFYNAEKLTTVTFAPNALPEKIGDSAFYRCTALKSITLPATEKKTDKGVLMTYTIGKYAFYLSKLESIVIPATVSQIGDYAFQSCKALKTITFAEGIDGKTLKLGTSCFRGTAITGIELPEGITSFPNTMFTDCKSLKSITIPSTVTTIGDQAFSGCLSLTEVIFGTYTGKDGKQYSNVNKFGKQVFEKTGFSTFAFPTLESATKYLTLGEKMFQYNNNLEAITLSRSVNKLSNVLVGCYNIKGFVIDKDNKFFSTEEGTPVLFNQKKTEYVHIFGLLSGDYVIPGSVTTIGANLFEGQIGITSLFIPYTVKSIGNYAFKDCRSLTSVVFEYSTAHPFQYEFKSASSSTYLFQYCYNLRDVTLPGNMKSIPNYMFDYCTSLEYITIPDSVTSIGTYAFEYSGLVEITIPAKVTTIGNYAFRAPTSGGSLTSLTFAKGTNGKAALTSIGNYAFQYQTFETVEIPKTVKTIGGNAFSYNPRLNSFTFEAGTVYAGTTNGSIVQYCTALTTFTFPAAVKTIGAGYFLGCSSLTSVNFADSSQLTTINGTVFKDTALESIEIPENVTSLGASAFENCTKLKSVTFPKKSKLTKILAYCFRNTGIESIEIPEGVTFLGNSATAATIGGSAYQFADCANLKTVVFKGQMTLFGGYVFKGCTSLTSFTVPASVEQIGNYCFQNCTNLKSVNIQSGGDLKIGSYAFDNTALTSITIPQGTLSIGSYAFRNCPGLKTVNFEKGDAELTINSYAFTGAPITSITIPARTESISTGAFKECTALRSVAFETGTTDLTIGSNVFDSCTALTTVVLPDNLEVVGSKAFYGNTALSSVYLGKVESIGSEAFRDCVSLQSITLPDSLKTIGTSAFISCSALQNVTMPENLVSIGANAFAHTLLTTLNVPASLTSIGDYAFGGCKNLTRFVVDANNPVYETCNLTANEQALVMKGTPVVIAIFPASVSGTLTLPQGYQLGAYALGSMEGITEVILPEGITEIPRYAFGLSCAKSVKIPASVTKIADGAFWSSDIESIEIPAGVTEIGANAFKNCASLTSITFAVGSKLETLGTQAFYASAIESIILPEGITALGPDEDTTSYLFQDCTNLKSVTFLGKLTSLNGYAFKGCSSLTSFTIPETVEYIGGHVFDASGLTTIEIPASIKYLYYTPSRATGYSYIFTGCTALETVILHEGLERIDAYAFQECTALKNITIPSTVAEIDAQAFKGCIALETIAFAPDCKATLGNNVFEASGLKNVVFPAGMTTLGTSTFKGCEKLESVTFLGDLVTLPNYTFQNCTALTSFTIPASVTTIGQSVFENTGLKNVVIPASATSLNSSIFKNCLALETAVFEDGCTTVSGSMFSGCTALRSVKLADTTTTISTSAFENCTALTTLVIPSYVTSVNKAFVGWTSRQTIRIMLPEIAAASKIFYRSTTNSASNWDYGCNARIVWNYNPEG